MKYRTANVNKEPFHTWMNKCNLNISHINDRNVFCSLNEEHFKFIERKKSLLDANYWRSIELLAIELLLKFIESGLWSKINLAKSSFPHIPLATVEGKPIVDRSNSVDSFEFSTRTNECFDAFWKNQWIDVHGHCYSAKVANVYGTRAKKHSTQWINIVMNGSKALTWYN